MLMQNRRDLYGPFPVLKYGISGKAIVRVARTIYYVWDRDKYFFYILNKTPKSWVFCGPLLYLPIMALALGFSQNLVAVNVSYVEPPRPRQVSARGATGWLGRFRPEGSPAQTESGRTRHRGRASQNTGHSAGHAALRAQNNGPAHTPFLRAAHGMRPKVGEDRVQIHWIQTAFQFC